jgi:4-amino-4-deoxy-L-arabinose transferase-like glycosyltransferase
VTAEPEPADAHPNPERDQARSQPERDAARSQPERDVARSNPGLDVARSNLDRALTLIVLVLVAYRLAYHATYLGEVPFAHATFSDGAVYEQAARDILADPPLGREAFYLQGAYAYFLALGMSIRAWPSLALLVQLGLAFATLALFQRSAIRLWGRTAGLLASIALLGHPILAFYENKYLSAELGIAFNVATLAAFVAVLERGHQRRTLAALGLGIGSGLAILARPNMILALPFSLLALVALTEGAGEDWQARLRASLRPCAALVLGLGLALAPMAARNLAVTGYPDVQPIHGGGTSFFIGNNPKARGVWNDGVLVSARLGTESLELGIALDIDPTLDDRSRARAIGAALYARSFAWIRANPGDWAVLELRKLWLTIGDEPLTQDYDWLGERELLPWAHRIGVSFSVLLALAWLGAGASLRERARLPERGPLASPAARRALRWFLAGQLVGPLAANLLFFTSAQHRLPLAIPLALLAGPGALVVVASVRDWRAGQRGPLGIGWVIVAALLLIQGPWPRSRSRAPSPVHYYNLAMVQDAIGEPLDALHSLDRALALRPEQPIFLLARAHLRYRFLDLDGAEADLAAIAAIAAREPVPAWLLTNAEDEAQSIATTRRMPTPPAAPVGAPTLPPSP